MPNLQRRGVANANLSQKLPSLGSIIDRQPLTVSPELSLAAVISLMSQAKRHTCLLSNSNSTPSNNVLKISAAARHSSVLVIADNRLVGIFTERDLVKLAASQTDLHIMTVGDVMITDLITLQLAESHTVMTALAMFQQHQIRHLPIIDDRAQLIGLVTPDHIRQVLQPINLLKFKSVAEAMTSDVIHAPPTATVLEIAQIMNDRNIGSIVIVDGLEPLKPVGIITERDIVQFQAFELDLGELLAAAVTSSPLFCLQPTDSLWAAQQIMKTKQIRRLVITNDRGELVGILTQSNLLQVLDPLEMLYMLDSLRSQLIDRATELEQTNQELQLEVARRKQVEAELLRSSQRLEERVVARTAELTLLTEELHVKIAEQQSCDLSLEISQQGISDFIENAPIGMHWLDFRSENLHQEPGLIVWANQAELEMLGYDREEYIGQSPIKFHLDRSKIEDIFQRLLSNQPIKGYETQMRRKDGSICDVSIDAHALFKNGRCIHARLFTSDITEQQAALRNRQQDAAALRQSEQRFRAIFDGTFQFIGLLDTEGILLEANRTALEAIGVTPGDVVGQAFWVTPWWTHSPDLQVQLQQAVTQAATGELVRFEAKHFLADGSYITVDFSLSPIFDDTGKVVMLIPEGRDISDRKQLERERERFLAVGSDLQVIADSNGYYRWVSPTFESILGWTAEEITSRPWIEFVHPDDISQSVAKETSLFEGTETIGFENRYRHQDGSYRWLSWNAQPYPEEQVIYAVAVDITEKKQLEQQFLRAQRMESLGSLASGIAHDLNNVLTPIVGAAQLLPLTLPNLDARSQRLLNMLVESSKRGSGLVKQILTFARGIDGEQTVLQVRHILAEIISVARQTFPKSIEINLNLESEDLWLVNVDATQIHQVLMNLFVNARDAMPNGGAISVSAENMTIEAEYTKLHLQPPVGSYILMTIADTGIGMTSEMLAKIFDPFFTTKETGTGLGLSTVQGIIKTHGGSIEVVSEVGQGTSFKIYLPAIDSHEAETPTVDQDLYDGKGQLVLVVDDEMAIREITKESLETYNYRVILASDGIEAIDIYAQNYHSIAIVLVDMMMPQLGTPSIILALQQINPKVKIVVMSGSHFNLEETVDKLKVSASLTKPFTTINMLQILENIQTES